MNKLTPYILFCIFGALSADSSPASAEKRAVHRMENRALLERSYRADLAYRILLRSSGLPVADSRIPFDLFSSPPEARQDPDPLLSGPKRPPSPSLIPTGLDTRVLKRLKRYDPLIERYSRMNSIDPNLVRALIYVESGSDPKAVSNRGAKGLMQLMPATASEVGVSNPFDAAQNIFGGTRYLGSLLTQFDHPELALWAYNAGPGAVQKKRMPLETKRFVPEVLRIKSILDRNPF